MNKTILNELFDYRDGAIYWKAKLAPCINVGERAGTLKRDVGYRQVRIKGVSYYEHRVIWIMHHGDIPEGMEVDHRDRVRSNNQISNLRLASRHQNAQNTKPHANTKSNLHGAIYHKGKKSPWLAAIKVNGKKMHLGYFKTPEEAHNAYVNASKKYHGQFSSTLSCA